MSVFNSLHDSVDTRVNFDINATPSEIILSIVAITSPAHFVASSTLCGRGEHGVLLPGNVHGRQFLTHAANAEQLFQPSAQPAPLGLMPAQLLALEVCSKQTQ